VELVDYRPAYATQEQFTDLGNARRLVDEHGHQLRYVPDFGCWHCWDGTRWQRDRDGEVYRRAKLSTRSMLHEAADMESDQRRRDLVRHAQRSQSESRLSAMVSLAESELDVIARADELDADPYLFNCANGTVDLRSGELVPHDPQHLLTKLAPVTYDPDAESKAWSAFLERTFDGDAELEGFFRRAIGYSLTADPCEEKVFFAHGPGATGKTTAFEIIRAALGDYATSVDFGSFLRRRDSGGPRNDVARLVGARLVVGAEVNEGQHLAEGLIKWVSGGDVIVARMLYKEHIEFRPAFTIWLAANARPRVNADDDALWRRLIQVPFLNVVPPAERDPQLKRKLREPDQLCAVLAWAVRGCLEWQQRGLDVPATVTDYTSEYRTENDPIASWLRDHCELAATSTLSKKDARDSYEAWATASGEQPISPKAFGSALKAKGVSEGRTGSTRYWQGIRLAGGVL
jgi:putative DNA primase/helicase